MRFEGLRERAEGTRGLMVIDPKLVVALLDSPERLRALHARVEHWDHVDPEWRGIPRFVQHPDQCGLCREEYPCETMRVVEGGDDD